MAFANFYFERQKDFQVKIEKEPNHDLKYIVVIPCYYEFELIHTLSSIWNSKRSKCSVEIIVVINSSENDEQKVKDQNQKTYTEAKNWIKNHQDSSLHFFLLNEENLPKKFAGAGLARKIGMDQALYRFNLIDQKNGVIVSLDADALIKDNYFTELDKQFQSKPKTNVATIYFEHPLNIEKCSKETVEAITIYELYLRYYKHALHYTGFPYSYYTVGSCFVINALAYAKQGGMSRKQAGEDFYLLHKTFPLGQHYEINSTCVYPSPRVSDRVPFGTGPMVKSIIKEGIDDFITYNFDSFFEIKEFLSKIDDLYKIKVEEIDQFMANLPQTIKDFLLENDIRIAIQEINDNSSNIQSFKKRFYNWFDAFRILKFLNFAHKRNYNKKSLLSEVGKLFTLLKIEKPNDISFKSYLQILRNTDRGF